MNEIKDKKKKLFACLVIKNQYVKRGNDWEHIGNRTWYQGFACSQKEMEEKIYLRTHLEYPDDEYDTIETLAVEVDKKFMMAAVSKMEKEK